MVVGTVCAKGQTMSSAGRVLIGQVGRDEGIYAARPSVLGNPFTLDEMSREECIEEYRRHLETAMGAQSSPLRRAVEGLARRVAAGETVVLLCYCSGKACHLEVLRETIERRASLVESLRERAPLPTEVLVSALQDPVAPPSGALLKAEPVVIPHGTSNTDE